MTSVHASSTSRIKALVLTLGLALTVPTCKAASEDSSVTSEEPRWFNNNVFEDFDATATNLYDLEFDFTFYGSNNKKITLNDCFEVLATGDNAIAERDFARWQLLQSDCEAANRFYRAPESAISYWEETFDFEILKTLPATAVPFLGGQGLEGRSGNLGKQEPDLTLVESGENSVKASMDDMVVNYVIVARADFNRNGHQDLFIRMDWYIENSFGDGSDWIVLTLTSPEEKPMMLWRR